MDCEVGRIRLTKKRNRPSWPTVVDLYCGSGAVTAALRRSKFKVVAAVDNDALACETYRLNHPSVKLIQKDILTVNPEDIRKKALKGKDLDLLVVCAPCQPFSNQNKKRGTDERSSLILQAGRFAKALRPKLIFFENVPGIASRSELLEELKREMGDDYLLGDPHKVDAADYGVPQRRVRCIMFATRKFQPPAVPTPTTPEGSRVTVRKTIEKLRKLEAGGSDPEDPLHSARNHLPIALKRLRAIPKNGGSRCSLPVDLKLVCHKGIADSKYSDVYGRMAWDLVAPTLTTGCTDITRGRFAHPEADRAITLREAALLQTFPKEYRFAGNGSDIQRQIGNAVPVQLVEALAPVFRIAIRENRA